MAQRQLAAGPLIAGQVRGLTAAPTKGCPVDMPKVFPPGRKVAPARGAEGDSVSWLSDRAGAHDWLAQVLRATAKLARDHDDTCRCPASAGEWFATCYGPVDDTELNDEDFAGRPQTPTEEGEGDSEPE